jgi:hypothetical protein
LSKPFGLKNDEYWTDPWKNLPAISWERVDKDIAGILLDAPDSVSLDAQESLPALAYHSDTTEALWQASFRDHGVLAAVRLEDDAFFAAKAVPPSGPEAPKGPEPSPGFAGEEYEMDLREALSLEWIPGNLCVTAFLRERASDRIKVTLGPSAAAYKDPAVERFLAEERAKLPQRSLAYPRQAAFDAVTVPIRPADGATLGLQFTAHRVMVADPGASGKLHVSWRLPVRPTDVTKDAPKALIKGLPPVTAVAAISILLIGSERGTPVPIRLRVPSFDPVAQEGGSPVATGSFTVDLLGLNDLIEEPQTWFIYGFAGEILNGPVTVAIVSPASLPNRGNG